MECRANGVRMNYERSGSGPPLLLLHGNGVSLRFFDPLVPSLEKQYTVYRLDSRRHGKSENTPDISYDLLALDCFCFIQAMGMRRPALIGSSDGAITGLLLSIKYPGLLACQVACGANTHPNQLKRWFYWLFKLAAIKTNQPNYRMVTEQPDITTEQLAAITTPTLVMAGEKDITRPGCQQQIAAAIPNAGLCILPGESHTSYLKKPKLFMDKAGPFLRKHTAAL